MIKKVDIINDKNEENDIINDNNDIEMLSLMITMI